jgi:hypothetical protein
MTATQVALTVSTAGERLRPRRSNPLRGGGLMGICRVCGNDGSPLGVVDAGEHAAKLAARESAEIVVARPETTRLLARDAIAALVRW